MFRRSVAAVVPFLLIFSIGLAQADSRTSLNQQTPSTYVLGPGDQIGIQLTPEGDEINGKLWRIDEGGELIIPLAGTVHAAGLTTHDLAGVLTERLRVYFRQPQVIVSVAEMRSQPGVQNSVKITEVFAFALFRVIVAISHVYRSIFACVHVKRAECLLSYRAVRVAIQNQSFDRLVVRPV